MKKEKNYITPAGYKRIEDELAYLIKEERPEVTKVVTWAASLGDRSENADYQYGKKRLREIDRRIRFLQSRINIAEIVEPTSIQSEKVQFGATVKIEGEQGEVKVYSIVGVDESDVKRGLISWKAPIGKSLIGKGIGDYVIVKSPAGETEFEILEIVYKEITI